MRSWLQAAVLLFAATFAPSPASAQTYPSRPIKIVASFPPGGGVDALARTVAPYLQQRLGQPVIVENKPGAGGTIGTDVVAKAPKDGYTLLVSAAGGFSTARALYPSLPYDPVKDLAPVTMGVKMPNLLLVHPSVKAKTIGELIALAKAEPGKLAFGSGGVGTTLHLSGELFKIMAGVDILHVPYKGSGPVLADLVSGQLLMAFTDAASIEHVRSGSVRALGQTSATRPPQLPDLPTIAEQGVPGYSAINWFAFFLPGGTPEPIVSQMHKELTAVLALPEVKQRLATIGMETTPSTPAELASFIVEDTKLWTEVIAKAGVKAQ